eukprot:COSAG02_NODE_5802_length_4026_cov_4.072320_6_plen_159_part_00
MLRTTRARCDCWREGSRAPDARRTQAARCVRGRGRTDRWPRRRWRHELVRRRVGGSGAVMATTAAFWRKLSAASANKVVPRVVSSGQGAYLTIGGRDYLNFCSSHYLGFAEDPRLKRAAQDAIDKYELPRSSSVTTCSCCRQNCVGLAVADHCTRCLE